MQIELLHDFIVLSEELNFRSAAKALFTTPSTLSKHIATLENHYGVRLFNRDRTSVSLTNKGVVLLEGAQKVWDAYEQTLELVKHDQNASTLHISGALDNPEDYPLVSRVITKFKVATGNIPHLLPSKSFFPEEQVSLLESGDSDCAVFYVAESVFRALHADASIEFYEVGRTRLDALVSESSPLAHKKVLELHDFEGQKLIQLVGPRLTPTWLQIKNQLDDAGVHYATTLFPASTPYDYLDLDPKGNVFLLPQLYGEAKRNQPSGCVRVPVDGQALTLRLAALVRKGPKRESALAFLQALSEAMDEARDEQIS